MKHYIAADLHMDIPAWIARIIIAELEESLAKHAKFVELYGV